MLLRLCITEIINGRFNAVYLVLWVCKTYGLITNKLLDMQKYTITDEMPTEGDYGINPEAPDRKPRKVERYSNDNDTLGMRLEPQSWFEWLPLRKHHRKVVFE